MTDSNSQDTKPVALVVGGNGAIGKVIVASLAQQGFAVVVASRSAATPGAEADPGIAASLAMDTTDSDQVEAGFSQLREQFGRLDLLVNAASPVLESAPLLRMSADQWEKQHAVHGRGAFLTSQQAAKIMRKQRQGRIINIASVVAHDPGSPGISAYAAAKAALVNLTKSLNQELNPVGIQATAICPTYVETPFWEEREMDASLMLKPEDVADTVGFLWNLPQHVRIETITLETPVSKAK